MSVTDRSTERVTDVIATLRAAFGDVTVRERTETVPRAKYRGLVNRFERGAVGGAAAWVYDDSGAVLLIRRADTRTWVDPGDSQRPEESLPETARRATRTATGLTPELTGLARITRFTYRVAEDWPPITALSSVFTGRAPSGSVPTPGDGIAAARFHDRAPDRLSYSGLTVAFDPSTRPATEST